MALTAEEAVIVEEVTVVEADIITEVLRMEAVEVEVEEEDRLYT